MENQSFVLNRGVFCGSVVEGPQFDHEVKDRNSNEVIKTYYLFKMEVLFENKKKTVTDKSVLPFLISDKLLDELGGSIEVGDILFTKGKLRAFDLYSEEQKRKTKNLRIVCSKIEKVDDYTRTRNKLEVYGHLKNKLFKVKFDEDGKVMRDEKNRVVPEYDENGELIPWTRKNNEGFRVNDVAIQVSKEVEEDGEVKVKYQDIIPAIAYGAPAWQIAKEIPVGTKVKTRGYVRCREKNGYPGEFVYEYVINRITPVDEEETGENKE